MTSITPLIISYNEAANIERVLARLTWAERVLVLDSGSTDGTQGICKRFANVHLLSRAFDSFAAQCNHGLGFVQTEWCLSIDADYVVPEATSKEMLAAAERPQADGYEARLAYCVRGRQLRHAILPSRVVLFRTHLGRYEQDGHAHRLQLNGTLKELSNPVLHDDRKSMSRWLTSQQTYAAQEAEKLAATPFARLSWPDRIRTLRVVAPWLVPSFYLLKGGVLDGWAGLDYAAQRAIAELVLSIALIERNSLGAVAHPAEQEEQPRDAARAASGRSASE